MLALLSFVGLLAALALGTWRRESVALAGILCLYGLKQWGQNSTAFFAQNRTVANFAIGMLVLLAALLRLARGRCLFCKVTSATWLTFGLFVYSLLTLIWSPNPDEALHQWSLQWLYVLMIVAVAPLLIDDIDDLRTAFNWTLVVGTALCALALFFGRWGGRGLLVYGDALESETNALAIASLGGTIAIVGTLSLQKGRSKWLRLVSLLAVPIGIAVVFRSLSRGQLVGAGVAILLAWPLAYKVRSVGSFFQLAFGLGALALVGWLAFDFVQIDAARWSSEQGAEDAAGRINAAVTLLGFAFSNPLALVFGLGNSSSFLYVGFYPHIAALEVLAEEGIVGFILFAAIVALAAGSIRKFVMSAAATDDRDRSTIAVLSAVFIFEFLLTFKQGSLLSCTYAFAYAMLLHKMAVFAGVRSAEVSRSTAVAVPAPSQFGNLMR